ncbi:acyltransferase family protein [soil metagenome]
MSEGRTDLRTGFRGDIQGLRAVAVLTVVAGHAGVSFLPGGYVGVDVFFVISGFLISQVLFAEVQRSGGLSLRDFYARRARRILPAATLVLAVTVIASVAWVSVVDALRVVTDALWATFFAANLRFAAVGTDYFAQEQGPSPLQHYWSLAVEEQFYLVWPLLIVGCLWLARRRRTDGVEPLPTRLLLAVLVGLGALSLAYGVLLTDRNPVDAYFSTPARAWELAVGAILAVVAPQVAARLNATARGFLAAVGLIAIAIACLAYDDGTAFPGFAALLPVLGSGAALLAGAGGHAREPWPIRALATGPLRVIGDWSYSLYLWHWPLLVIPRLALDRPLTTTESVAAVAGAFLLAGATFHFVETPLRSARRLPRPRALALYPASVATIALVCALGNAYGQHQVAGGGEAITVANSGILDEPSITLSKNPTVALVQASVEAARQGHAIPGDLRPGLLALEGDVPSVGECDYVIDTVRTLCPGGVGDTGPDAKTIVVLGNSHGRMWIPAFEQIALRGGYTTYYLVKSNCTAADLLVGDLDRDNDPWQACSDFRDWALDQIAELRPDLTVISTSGPNAIIYTDDGRRLRQVDPDRPAVVQQGFVDTFDKILPVTSRLVLLRDIPKADHDPGPCLTQGDADLGTCLFTPIKTQELDSQASVDAAIQADVEHIDPTKWVCWQKQCPVVIGDVLPYRDRGHLSAEYAGDLADDLGRRLGLWNGD